MKGRFFIVHINCSIHGHSLRHGVCYPLYDGIIASVEEMVKNGVATIFEEEVRIISGAVYSLDGTLIEDVKKEQAGTQVSTVLPSAVDNTLLVPVYEEKVTQKRKVK